MRSVSIGVRDAILNGKRPFIKALVTYRDGFSEWLYDDDFMQNSVQFQNGTSSKGNFEIGAAVIGAFSFNLNNWDHKFDTRNFDGAMISAFIGINPMLFGYALVTENNEEFVTNDGVDDLRTEKYGTYGETSEWFQFGQYYFVKHKSVGNVIVCDAYDAMKLFDESLLTDNSIVYPISAKNLVRMIADHNGITLKNYDFPNGDTVISEAPEDDCTERQMLAYVCQMIGCFARINSTGQLDINWYDDIPATTIMHRFSHSLATEDITITGLRMSYKDVDDQDVSSLFLYRKPYKGVLLTFDERSATENSYDRVVIYYKSGNSYKMSSRFTGNGTNNNIAGKTFYIPSNEFWVYWHTNTSNDAFWGWAFTVTPATTVKSETLSTVSSLPAYDIADLPADYYPQSEHDGHYSHGIDKLWHCKASYYIDTTKDSGQWIPMSGIEADNTDYVLEISGNPLINASNYEDIEELLADKLIGLTFRHGDMSILANPTFEAGDVVTTFDDKGNRALFLITNIDYSLTVQQTISCDAQEIEKSDLRSIKSTTVARREAKSVIRNEMTAYDTQYMRLTQLMTQSLGFFETKETTPSGGYIYYMHNNPDLHESSIIWKMTENTFTVSTDGGQTWNAGITADGNALVNVLSAKGINADWLNTGSIIVQKNGQTVFLADYDTGVVRIVADEFSLSNGDTIRSIANSAAATKRRVFVTQPVPPYDVGDLWAQGANGDILKCKTAKSSEESYNADDWEKASNYVDQDTAKNYTIAQMTQTEVFNKLTNNGTMAGIFMQNDQLYINASYIQSGTLKLGGVNNANGVLEVYNASGTLVGKFDKDGLVAKSLTADSYIEVDGTAASSIKMNYKTYYSHKGSCELNGDGITVNMWGWISNDQVGSSGGDYVVKLGKRIDPLDDEFSQPYYCYPITMKISHVDGHSDYSSVSFLGPYEFGIGSGTFKTLIMPGVINLTRGKNNYSETNGCTCLSCDGINTVDLLAEGNLVAWGTKSRSVSTPDYSDRLLYCYETPSPLFGDVGEGIIGDDGNCYVWIDSIFAETVTLNQYQVFLQKYGDGDCYVKERKPSYFVVSGTPGMAFGWELKAKQSDFDQLRLEKRTDKVDLSTEDFGAMAESHLAEIKKERGKSND